MEIATAFGQVQEEEQKAGWGGWYSVYRLPSVTPPSDEHRAAFVRSAKEIGASVAFSFNGTSAWLVFCVD